MKVDFTKNDGLVPVIVQHAHTLQVLMLGYMNEEALAITQKEERVTFFSRSKNRLWTKGETSGHFLRVKEITADCDGDTLLVKAVPRGPTCHTGSFSCFGKEVSQGYVYQLEQTVHQRIEDRDEGSYTNRLFRQGINKVAQKVGEEAVELVIEAMDRDDDRFLNEAADLLYHFLILLKAKGRELQQVEAVLQARRKRA